MSDYNEILYHGIENDAVKDLKNVLGKISFDLDFDLKFNSQNEKRYISPNLRNAIRKQRELLLSDIVNFEQIYQWAKSNPMDFKQQILNTPLDNDLSVIMHYANHIRNVVSGTYFDIFNNDAWATDNCIAIIECMAHSDELNTQVIVPAMRQRGMNVETSNLDDLQPQPEQPETPQNINSFDEDKLAHYFNSNFKGINSGINLFSKMIEEIPLLKTKKQRAMVAHMIYNSRYFLKHKVNTFASWLRIFFECIGQECPKDTRRSKYEPDENIEKRFGFLYI